LMIRMVTRGQQTTSNLKVMGSSLMIQNMIQSLTVTWKKRLKSVILNQRKKQTVTNL
jgi:hypothetical protein